MSNLNKVLQAFNGIKSVGKDEYKAICPCHTDKKPSLGITYLREQDKILLHCLANCNTKDIISAVGLTWNDIQPAKERKKLQAWEKGLIARYDYTDEAGNYLYSKLRYPGENEGSKKIVYARIYGNKYLKGKGNNDHVLYKLPEMLKAIHQKKTIFYVEGEKDVNTMNALGLPATTAGSTSDWNESFSKYFKGADVVILGDNDEAGKNLVHTIEQDIKSIAFSVRSLFPSDKDKGDITDFIEEGHSKADLFKLLANEEKNFASWFDDKHGKVNPGLLSESILQHNHFISARHPGTDTDLLFIYQDGYYKRISDDEVINIIRDYIPVVYLNPALLKNVTQLIKYGADGYLFEDLNNNERCVNCMNGIYDTTTRKLLDHDPDYSMTIQIKANYLSDGDPPLWLAFIQDLTTDEEGNHDQEEAKVIQELSGLILSTVYGYRLKKAFVLYSPNGNTGKSVFLSVMEHLLGSEAFTATDFRKLSSSRWATGSCFGKRLVAVGDQGAGEITDSSIFKSMTGADAIPAEFKGMQPFSYVFKGVIVLACNQLPYFSDDKGNHLADRLMLIPCRNVITPDKRDPDLIEKLLSERDGILAWSIEGLNRLISNHYRFSTCKASEDLMKSYRSSHDTLYDFFNSECVITDDKADHVRKTELEEAYFTYCQEHDLEPLLKRNIKQRAASLGIITTMLDGYEVYRKIRLKDKDFILADDPLPF